MTDDPPDIASLEQEYATAVAYVRRFLASEFDLDVVRETSPDFPPHRNLWREVWQIPISIPPKTVRLIIAVPMTFPDDLPYVFLPKELTETGISIPHLNDEREFCTFDKTEAQPNADKPLDVVLAVIERAKRLLEDGLSGANAGDYTDEFEAYWKQATSVEAISLVIPMDNVKRIVALQMRPAWKDWSYLFTDHQSDGERWLASAGYRHRLRVEPVIYLPLANFGLPPYPKTNGEIYNRLRRFDPAALQCLLEFLQKQPRPTGILFSVPVSDGKRALGAWWHPTYAHHVYRGAKKGKRYAAVMAGFTTGNHSVEIELSMKNRAGKLIRASVERVDGERLLARTTGTVSPIRLEHPVNIVGCGSVGSIAAACLAAAGVVKGVRLIDPERLAIENVARHHCGMADVGEYKVTAVSDKIQSHYPHVKCIPLPVDILNLLRTHPTSIDPTSLTLVSVGSLAIERRLNRLAWGDPMQPATPYCYVWVEPHLYGGHALLIKKRAGGCFECAFDDSFVFTRRVLKDSAGFSFREAGCRSTYVPYSGLYASEFVSTMLRFLLSYLRSPENMVFTWVGDLDAARSEGVLLEAEWASVPPFTSYVRKLEPKANCLICAPK